MTYLFDLILCNVSFDLVTKIFSWVSFFKSYKHENDKKDEKGKLKLLFFKGFLLKDVYLDL